MKRILFCLSVGVLLLAGCRQGGGEDGNQTQGFRTKHLEGRASLVYREGKDDPFQIYVKNSYSIEWPVKGLLSDATTRELMMLCFGDSMSTDIEQVTQRWLQNLWIEEEPNLKGQQIDTIPNTAEFEYTRLENAWRKDNNLVTFTVVYTFGGSCSHGFYTEDYVTIDLDKGDVIHLVDLVDTARLDVVIARAIHKLEENKETRENLFEVYRKADKIPMSQNFFIDSTRSNITVTYGLYDISPFAAGIQYVVLPVDWLSKQVKLTPYAKHLFGIDSLEE